MISDVNSKYNGSFLWGFFPIIVTITIFIGYPKGEILGTDVPLHIAAYYIIACFFVISKTLLTYKTTFYSFFLRWFGVI